MNKRDLLVRINANTDLTEEEWGYVRDRLQDTISEQVVVFDKGDSEYELTATEVEVHLIPTVSQKQNEYFGHVMGEINPSIMYEPFDNAKKYVRIAAATHAGSNIPTIFCQYAQETVTVNANAYRDNPDAAVLNAVREQLGWVVESVDYEEVDYVEP